MTRDPPHSSSGRRARRLAHSRAARAERPISASYARPRDHIIDRAARYDLEIAIYRSMKVETFEFAVDQNRSRTISLQHQPSTKLGKLDLARRRGGARTSAQAGAVAGVREWTKITRSGAP